MFGGRFLKNSPTTPPKRYPENRSAAHGTYSRVSCLQNPRWAVSYRCSTKCFLGTMSGAVHACQLSEATSFAKGCAKRQWSKGNPSGGSPSKMETLRSKSSFSGHQTMMVSPLLTSPRLQQTRDQAYSPSQSHSASSSRDGIPTFQESSEPPDPHRVGWFFFIRPSSVQCSHECTWCRPRI